MTKDNFISTTIKDRLEKLTLKLTQEEIEKVFYEVIKDNLKSKNKEELSLKISRTLPTLFPQ
jgi:hypothetical protein